MACYMARILFGTAVPASFLVQRSLSVKSDTALIVLLLNIGTHAKTGGSSSKSSSNGGNTTAVHEHNTSNDNSNDSCSSSDSSSSSSDDSSSDSDSDSEDANDDDDGTDHDRSPSSTAIVSSAGTATGTTSSHNKHLVYIAFELLISSAVSRYDAKQMMKANVKARRALARPFSRKLTKDMTDGTVPVERTEPATTEAKREQYEQWYARVNSECKCSAGLCGDKYRAIVQEITAQGATSCKKQRELWRKRVRNISLRWCPQSKHYSKQSATCDHTHMPSALLPRMGRSSCIAPDKWPYLSQSTVNDVRAMRIVRSCSNSSSSRLAMWQKLQQRLQQYAATGAGTVAEAIVTNDNWWSCQVAHELPSGGKSKAMKRRYSKGSATDTTGDTV
eukprot:7260-Heterococcus_DN1.PRE.3